MGAVREDPGRRGGSAVCHDARCRHEPKYFVLPIASGDLLVTDPAFTGWLLNHDRKRAVIEMEGAGAARAVKEYDRDVALLVLRGISDFADERKADLDAVVSGQASGAWRRYAAENAIDLLFAFLASPSFPWRIPAFLATGQPDVTATAVSVADAPAPRSRRAWDYFMQAAQLVEATAAGVELVRALRPDHPAVGGGHHESDGAHHGDQGHRDGHGGGSHGQDAGHESSEHDAPAHHDMNHDVAVEPDLHIHTHLHLTDPHDYHS